MKRLLALCTTIAMTVALASSSFAGTNLLANPGFEDADGSYNGWFTFGAGPNISTPATDNIAHTGIAAAKIFGEFTNCPGLPQFDVGGFGQSFTPVAGDVYTFEGFTYIDSGDPMTGVDVCVSNRLLAQIAYFDAAVGGAVIATQEVIVGDASMPTDQWVEFSVTSAPAPANAMRVEALFLFLQPACDMGAVYVDDVVFCVDTPTPLPNLLANPSFDTNLVGWTTFGNVFHDGRREFRFTPPGSAKLFGTFSMGNDSGMFQAFAAAPGQLWRFDVNSLTTCVEDVINLANPNQAIAKIVFRDGGGVDIGGVDQVIRNATSPLGTWTHDTLFAVAPAATSVLPARWLKHRCGVGGRSGVCDRGHHGYRRYAAAAAGRALPERTEPVQPDDVDQLRSAGVRQRHAQHLRCGRPPHRDPS
jgi:hypothetical protein